MGHQRSVNAEPDELVEIAEKKKNDGGNNTAEVEKEMKLTHSIMCVSFK